MTERAAAIDRFLKGEGWGDARRQPLAGDASFRRYVRLVGDGGSAMLMDAPPEFEDVRPFVTVAEHLSALGFSAPCILARDLNQGFLILEDLGDDTYTKRLDAGGDEEELYALAVDVLIALHKKPTAIVPGLPLYDDGRLLSEARLLVDWYVPAIAAEDGVGGPADETRLEYDRLWRQVMPRVRQVPDTLVLRDYHVDNLMWLPGRAGVAACGLLDFQDAVAGPVSYDLISLLEDARRDLPAGLADRMFARYLDAFPTLDRDAFWASCAIMAAMRNAKIIGIFTRLDVRDGKPIYLKHIPRVWRLLQRDLEHPVLAPVKAWFARHIPAAARRVPASGSPA
ncbi:MAG: phosphotransferase [Alphaproteobacteria bacterium]